MNNNSSADLSTNDVVAYQQQEYTVNDDDEFYQTLGSFSYESDNVSAHLPPTNNLTNSLSTSSVNPIQSSHDEIIEQLPSFNFLTAMTESHNLVDVNNQQQLNMSTPTCHNDEQPSPINKSSVHKSNSPVAISSVTGRPLYPRQRHTGNTRCANCGVDHTPMWRKGLQGEILCNKCGLYLTRHGKERPLNLQESEDNTSSQEKPKKRRSKTPNDDKKEKKQRNKTDSNKTCKRSLEEKTETKAKKKIKSTVTDLEVNTSQTSPVLDAILGGSNPTFKIPSPNQSVSNQLVASPNASYWNNANNSPISVQPFQAPIMVTKEQPTINVAPNDWILNQLSTCTQPVMQKQVWPSYTIQQSSPNTVIYSSETNQNYQPWNNCFTSSPVYQSEDQLFNNFFTTENNVFHQPQQSNASYSQYYNQGDMFALKLDQHDLMSELLSDYQFIQ